MYMYMSMYTNVMTKPTVAELRACLIDPLTYPDTTVCGDSGVTQLCDGSFPRYITAVFTVVHTVRLHVFFKHLR